MEYLTLKGTDFFYTTLKGTNLYDIVDMLVLLFYHNPFFNLLLFVGMRLAKGVISILIFFIGHTTRNIRYSSTTLVVRC